jgi:hypothetical protein
MRATRALLRRRMPLARQRGTRLAHGHHTHRQYTLPAIGTKIADQANRAGVAERFAAPAVPKSIAVDLALSTSDDALRREVERSLGTTAKHQDAHTRSLRQTVPGSGTMLRRVLLYDIHAIARFPRVQDCASSCRRITCARASAGQRSGPAGATSGNAHRTWACAEAAVFCLRAHPAAQPLLSRVAQNHGKGQALTILAHPVARAVSSMLKRQTACALQHFLQASGRGVGARKASLDSQGMPLLRHAQPMVKHCVVERP